MPDLQRLTAARDKLAYLVVDDPAFLPIFERIEEEIAMEKDQLSRVNRAAKIIRRREDLARLL